MASRRAEKYLPAAIILTSTWLFFSQIIMGGKTFFFRDFQRAFYPAKHFLATALKDFGIPYWNPYLFCGGPFASFVANAVFYPLSIIFLLPAFPFSLNVFIVLHFLLGFLFFYLFIIASGLSWKAGVITGISFCYGSYTIASINVLSHLATLVWVPAILWSFREVVANGKSGHLFGTIIFFCMALLAGAPQLLIITAGMLFFISGFWLPAGESVPRGLVKNFVLIGLTLGIALAITLIQIGPLYIDYKNSIRLAGISYTEATEHSLNPAMLKHFIIPLWFPADFSSNPASLTTFFPGDGRVPWLLTIYPGFLVMPLALLGVCFHFSKEKAAWLVLFLLGTLLALGENTPLYRAFYTMFPSFRFPVKFIFMANFGLLVLAAHGFDGLLHLIHSKRTSGILILTVTIIAMTVDLYAAHRYLNPLCDTGFYQYRRPEMTVIHKDKGLHRIFIDPDITALSGSQASIQNTHIHWQSVLAPNLGMLDKLSHVGVATGLELQYQYVMTELLLKPWPEKIDFLRLANVKYIVSSHDLADIPELDGTVEKLNSLVYRIKDPLPRAWLVGGLQAVETDVLAGLSHPAFNMHQTALTQDNNAAEYRRPAYTPATAINYSGNNNIHIAVTADSSSVLVLTESAYPGWRVWVDGVEKKCLKLNYLFLGVEVGKGLHRIDFIYRPQHAALFLSISSISLLLFFICAAVYYKAYSRRRR